MSMLFSAFVSSGASGPTVDTTVITDNSTFRGGGATCHAYLKCDSDGDWYESSNTGAYGTSEGAWLTSGLVSEVWIERTIVSGTPDVDDIGAGRTSCSLDLEIGVQQSGSGTNTLQVSFEFFDASSGGNSLGSTGTIFIVAEKP